MGCIHSTHARQHVHISECDCGRRHTSCSPSHPISQRTRHQPQPRVLTPLPQLPTLVLQRLAAVVTAACGCRATKSASQSANCQVLSPRWVTCKALGPRGLQSQQERYTIS